MWRLSNPVAATLVECRRTLIRQRTPWLSRLLSRVACGRLLKSRRARCKGLLRCRMARWVNYRTPRLMATQLFRVKRRLPLTNTVRGLLTLPSCSSERAVRVASDEQLCHRVTPCVGPRRVIVVGEWCIYCYHRFDFCRRSVGKMVGTRFEMYRCQRLENQC